MLRDFQLYKNIPDLYNRKKKTVRLLFCLINKIILIKYKTKN